MIQHYNLDEEATLAEMKILKQLPCMESLTWREAAEKLAASYHEVLPNLAYLASVALVLPVSTAGNISAYCPKFMQISSIYHFETRDSENAEARSPYEKHILTHCLLFQIVKGDSPL